MKTVIAVIIKHPAREFDYRVDIIQVEENVTFEDAIAEHKKQMLGPFEIVSFTEKITNTQILPTRVIYKDGMHVGNIDTSMHVMD